MHNIIVYFTDQQRWDTLGLNGNPLGLTPNCDHLARSGTFFSEAVTYPNEGSFCEQWGTPAT